MRQLHSAHNGDGADTYRGDTHQQIDDLLLVVREAVGVKLLADGRVLGFFIFVLVENPFER